MKYLLFILICISVKGQEFIPFFSTTTGNGLLNNLTAYWAFEEGTAGNALDSSTNNRTLTAAGPISTSGEAGIVGLTRDMSEFIDNDYFTRASEGPLNFNTNTAFTITCWFRISTSGATLTGDMSLLGKSDTSTLTNSSWWLLLDHATPNDFLRFCYSTNGNSFDFSTFTDSVGYDFGGAIDQEVWYFVAVRWNGSIIHISVTEQSEGGITSNVSKSFSGPMFANPSVPITVGTITGDNIHDLGGNIDEVGIWSSYLSDCQLTHLFNARNGSFSYSQFDSASCAP